MTAIEIATTDKLFLRVVRIYKGADCISTKCFLCYTEAECAKKEAERHGYKATISAYPYNGQKLLELVTYAINRIG